jgi:hypothetical protein
VKILKLANPVLLVALLVGAPCLAASPAGGCTTSREYITTLEYLRDAKSLSVPEEEARKLAGEVARGCSGAADRFIRVTELLLRAGLTGKDAVRNGKVFAAKDKVVTETFITVFKGAFFEDGLDLDISAALRMALSLSAEFPGDIVAVQKDFEKLVGYCVNKKRLDLPRPKCGGFAAGLLKKGQSWQGGVFGSFEELFEFLTSSEGAGIITSQALQLSEEAIAGGPDSPRNFIQAYKYASSEKGLKMDRSAALAFARELALSASLSAQRH